MNHFVRLALLACLSGGAAADQQAAATVGAADCHSVNRRPQRDQRAEWSGVCKDGYADGNGVVQCQLGDQPTQRCEGDLKQGGRAGHGVFPGNTGDRYEGSWVANRREGRGVRLFALGGRYDGGWKAGRFHGAGVLVYEDGRRAEGEFRDGAPLGRAVAALPVPTYALKRDTPPTGSHICGNLARNSPLPYEKSYAELPREQQLIVKAAYPMMGEGAAPPYPVAGTRGIVQWMAQAQAKL